MVWKQAKTYWNLAFLCGDVWALSRWLRPVGVTVPVNLGEAEYAVLFTLFTGGLAIINWPWVRRLRPANRFYDLTPEIKAAHRSFMEDDFTYVGESPNLTGKTRAAILVITHKLESLGVSYPPMDVDVLRMWFPVIQAMAETKRLADARTMNLPRSLRVSAGAAEFEFKTKNILESDVTLTPGPWWKKVWPW